MATTSPLGADDDLFAVKGHAAPLDKERPPPASSNAPKHAPDGGTGSLPGISRRYFRFKFAFEFQIQNGTALDGGLQRTDKSAHIKKVDVGHIIPVKLAPDETVIVFRGNYVLS